MTEALQDNNIDVAFLWSICPETFSFTLYESLAAGCTVLTNRNSGNIQAYVREHPEAGIVLEHENALLSCLRVAAWMNTWLESKKKEENLLN